MKAEQMRPEDWPSLEWWSLELWLRRRRVRRSPEEEDVWPGEEIVALILLEIMAPRRYVQYVRERYFGSARESIPSWADPEIYPLWHESLHPPGIPLHLSDRKSRKRRRSRPPVRKRWDALWRDS